ncbi:MAG: type II secretion system F family protein [Proteobacteria bacterium]|nr:type II secretion system F family protein [Pseudomonadota bacterium]
MNSLLSAGVQVSPAIRGMVDQAPDQEFRAVMEAIWRRLETGTPLHEALKEHPSFFPEEIANLVQAGEESGKLPYAFAEIRRYLEWVERMMGDVRQATLYPTIVLVFLSLWMILVYAPITHWVWGGGFLAEAGVLDFAGGTVVHINSGVAALVGAMVLGRRRGYGTENMAPHNLILSVIGASMLWVGWFGFNAGSAVAANGSAGMAMAVTQIAAAAAALSWMFAEWISRGKPSVLGIVSGAVSGLVAITPASGYVDPFGALVIGLVAGLVCYWGAVVLKPKLGYDDSLDVFGVHGLGGITGALLTGVFAVEAIGGTPGLLEGNAGQVLIQLEGIAATIVYCAIVTFVLLKVIGAVMGLRVDEEEEVTGLDYSLHGETVQ